MSFSMETEKESILSFLDFEIICEQGKFTTTIYRKPTFRGIYSNFLKVFIIDLYRFGMVYTLVYRCFHICFLKQIFQKNAYPENFNDKCFKMFSNNTHLVKENEPTVKKKAYLVRKQSLT